MMTLALTPTPTITRLAAAIADHGPIAVALHARYPDLDQVLEILDWRYLGAYASPADWALDYVACGFPPVFDPGDFDAATFADDAIASGDIAVIALEGRVHVFDGDLG